MRRSVPTIARSAKSLLEATDAGCTATSPAQQCAAASAQRSLAAAAAPGATPAPGSPTAEAHAAITSQRTSRGSSSSSTSGGGGSGGLPPNGGPDPSSSGGGGGGWFFPALTLAAAGGGYYAYTQKNNGTEGGGHKLPQGISKEQLDATQKAALDLLQQSKQKLQELLPAALGGTSKKQTAPDAAKTPSSSSSSLAQQQKQRDQEDAGFKMLPPGREDASAAAAAADAAASASAAARDSLSAAADEFPGSTEGAAAATQQGPAVVLEDLRGLLDVQQVDLTPITDLFADVTGIDPSATSSGSGSKASAPAPATDAAAYNLVTGVTTMQASPAAAAAAPAAMPAQSREPTVALKEVEDSELEKLCQKLGLSKDLAPSGLVAAANRAGLGSVNSSGAHLPPQMAQLNQATADARILGEVLELSAQNTAKLVQELEEARRHAAWTEEAAEKRETSLTEHFKELMREQSRIHQQLTEAAVKEAEQVVIADTVKAHLHERQERLQQIDALRDKVNALAVAFDQRTAQLRSVQDVNRVSVGMLSLSKALEEGTPVGSHLQQLVSSCPDDPLIEAVAASLPASAASQGLPTLQELRERFSDVAQAAAEASFFAGQDAQGGVLAHLAAKLAAKLKVDAGPDVANRVDGKLSQARALLQTGQLCAAAEALLDAADGTQAAAVVQQWVADARARAAADQAVKLLQAHATATAGLTS